MTVQALRGGIYFGCPFFDTEAGRAWCQEKSCSSCVIRKIEHEKWLFGDGTVEFRSGEALILSGEESINEY